MVKNVPLPHHDIILVERAVSEMKRGIPVIIESANETLVLISVEYTDQAALNLFKSYAQSDISLLLTSNRANALSGSSRFDSPLKLVFKDIPSMRKLSGLISYKTTPALGDIRSTTKTDDAALYLVKIAELLPSVLVAQMNYPLPTELISLTPEHIFQYKQTIALTLEEISRVHIPLHRAEDSRIVAFRSAIGGKEHYAILIGAAEKQKSPLVRVHSSCYTGDLLASLACDCRDQLHTSIRLMSEGDGGIILYLQQEGRGIGLSNKIRAYALKETGMDTVDANEALGFDDDERLFQPAAEMLKALGVKSVKLLSNNPRKADGLIEFGIHISSTVPHIMPVHEHNAQYLATKEARLGHTLGTKSNKKKTSSA